MRPTNTSRWKPVSPAKTWGRLDVGPTWYGGVAPGRHREEEAETEDESRHEDTSDRNVSSSLVLSSLFDQGLDLGEPCRRAVHDGHADPPVLRHGRLSMMRISSSRRSPCRRARRSSSRAIEMTGLRLGATPVTVTPRPRRNSRRSSS